MSRIGEPHTTGPHTTVVHEDVNSDVLGMLGMGTVCNVTRFGVTLTLSQCNVTRFGFTLTLSLALP